MPHISATDFELVRHIIAPSNFADLRQMETEIFELNKQIRSLPGRGPSPAFFSLLDAHRRLLAAYHEAGGRDL